MTQTETIPTGYKKTEIGIIPEDWNVKTLVEVTENVKVGLATSVTRYYRNKGIPIIRNLNIKDGFFDDRDMLYLDEDFAKANLSKSAKGLDVLTVHTGANLGLTCVLPKRYDKCQTFTTLITTPKKSIIDSYYLCYHMGSFFGKKEMNKLEVGGGKGNLNTADLKKYRIFFPSNIKEQKAIARVLSDMDALIESLEKLIAKKKAIKQGAMQHLLTGKKRLPGFSGKWEVKKLSDVVNTSSGGTPSRNNLKYYTGNIPWVTTSELKDKKINDTLEHITKEALNNSSAKIFPKHTVLIAMYGATIGRLGILSRPSSTNQACCALICQNHLIDYKFLYYKLFTMREFIISFGCGAGQPNISQTIIKSLKITIPLVSEQTAIANILSDMDSEIEKLEQKKDKYISLKQGMMQQLLTGKIRLVKNGDN
jgi:type I restriction enzyme, S subunit